jgi:hypothetical protein
MLAGVGAGPAGDLEQRSPEAWAAEIASASQARADSLPPHTGRAVWRWLLTAIRCSVPFSSARSRS